MDEVSKLNCASHCSLPISPGEGVKLCCIPTTWCENFFKSWNIGLNLYSWIVGRWKKLVKITVRRIKRISENTIGWPSGICSVLSSNFWAAYPSQGECSKKDTNHQKPIRNSSQFAESVFEIFSSSVFEIRLAGFYGNSLTGTLSPRKKVTWAIWWKDP